MVNESLYNQNAKESYLQIMKGKWYGDRKKQYLKQYAERIKPRKGRKVWELERTVEGYTRIRKVRL